MSSHARRGRYATVVGVVLAAAGTLAVTVAVRAQQHAPEPSAAAASPVPADTPPSGATPPAHTGATVHKGPILAPSSPTRLTIPAIGVDSVMHGLGNNPDHTVQVPPLGKDSWAGWYRYSPSPGQLGPSIVLGHIDSARYGPGVFFKLGALHPRDQVSIARADGSVAVFRIDRVVQYPKAHFPTGEVYGNTDHAALRLITCGGKFDPSVRSYEDNIVAYASLVSSHHS